MPVPGRRSRIPIADLMPGVVLPAGFRVLVRAAGALVRPCWPPNATSQHPIALPQRRVAATPDPLMWPVVLTAAPG
jgi:hypothetical protein